MKLPPLPGLVLIVVLWAVFYAGQGVYAETTPGADTRVLIDISGSMKKTDPQNLRVPAVKLLLNLAKEDSRFGVWSFGRYVNNLVPSANVNTQWKAQAAKKVEAINSAGLFTNIGLALEKATNGNTVPDPGWERTLILLSDGMVDISKDPEVNAQEKKRILTELVPKIKQAGFRIHGVALSEQADQDFLKELSLETGGGYSLARNADELMAAFVKASDKVNAPEQVPLENNSFEIDNSIKEFTALIFRRPNARDTQLVAPDGIKYSLSRGSRNVSWFTDKQYDLITVYNPAPGTWKVIADLDPSNRVTVISDLNVTMGGLPENVLEGERLTMTMQMDEQGRVITNPNFLELMDITFRQETDSGETFEGKLSHNPDGSAKIPEDGIYQAKLGRTITQGQHTFSVIVDGKTFKRKKSQTVTVHNEVLQADTQYSDNQGEVLQSLVMTPNATLVQAESLSLVAQITDPKGEKTIQNGVQQEDGNWRIDVVPFGAQGEYEVRVKVSGNSLNQKPFEMVQGPYSVDYTPLGINSEPQPEAPETVEPEPVLAEPFDPAAMEVPDLEVEELPPDDMPPLEEELPPIAEESVDDPVDEEEIPEESNDWLMLMAAFILGNLLILGGGIFLYLKFLRKTDAEQNQVVEEIAQLQEQKRQKQDPIQDPVVALESEQEEPQQAEPVMEPAEEVNSMVDPEFDLSEDETQIRTQASDEPDTGEMDLPDIETATESSVQAEPPLLDDVEIPNPEPAPEPAPPKEAEEAYINEAEPLELDDDEMIEIDDDFEDEDLDAIDADTSLEELDMMLSEQEQGEEQTEEQLNKTIDEMLDAPTEFPDPTDDDDDSSFDDDEFMLDDPKKG